MELATVILGADAQRIIASGMPVVIAAGFFAIWLLRRRDRRRTEAEEREED